MTGVALARPLGAIMWELRTAWATGKRVSLTLDTDEPRIEGHITQVAATDAFIEVDRCHVAGETILAVHLPSRLGDSDFGDDRGQLWHGRALRPEPPQREELPLQWGAR